MPRTGDGFVSDPRISKNGFAVSVNNISDGGGQAGILVGTPKDVNFMGAVELAVTRGNSWPSCVTCIHFIVIFQSLVTLISVNPKISMRETRPLKVKAFLEAEAVRMVRQNPPGIDRDAALETWTKLCSVDTDISDVKCLHAKLVCQLVASLP